MTDQTRRPPVNDDAHTLKGENVTWVEIASSGTEDEATLLSGFLEAEGIPAQVENVKFSMEPINFGTLGDIRIYVPAQDEARAQELLRDRQRQYERLDDDTETVVTDEGETSIDELANGKNEREP
ncbi:MAG TPA: DUF2007 domain-containing protein [Thermoanaerobaculia bacterium]|nr:DUF2007 domain-containing protein [Thermoanaerobaculia bacterium]